MGPSTQMAVRTDRLMQDGVGSMQRVGSRLQKGLLQ